ncbi:sulfate ABC transporter permease subunit CysT [Microbispora bryophytorum]|uniref:Sulfate transport system permease protein CysT n=1 Tax=Microbispora bryophytorum subsp. camponoti TaxID=1677852 RepID=A0ABR8L6U2_9ACTN|nr:sulfate ABC transporter permease subunit CysT [Microbispora camponoti]MBD3145692.1 sulfate ABC transporter permease subunit CysT [Microbispora camponoti]
MTLEVTRDATAITARPVRRLTGGTAAGLGTAVLYLSLIVLIPLAAVVWRSAGEGPGYFWRSVTTPDAWAALTLTIGASALVALVNLVMGTVIAWVLVRDRFPGRAVLDTIIDLPFALPTIVAGLVLLALYGPQSPLGINLAYSRAGVVLALLFVTLPFVVRTVQPVLLELDTEMEQAAASLGAGPFQTFRRVILPNLIPAMLSGTALAFTRAIAEFGSTVLISGNLPFKTQVAAVNIFSQIEGDDTTGAAAISTVLLVVALVALITLDILQRWGSRRG